MKTFVKILKFLIVLLVNMVKTGTWGLLVQSVIDAYREVFEKSY